MLYISIFTDFQLTCLNNLLKEINKMKPNANNLGGRTFLTNQMINHQIAVANAKPTLNTRKPLPTHPSAKLTPEQRVQRKTKALFEMEEVYATFKKVANVKKGRIDTAPPPGFEIMKKAIPKYKKLNDFQQQEHYFHLRSQQRRIQSIGKSMVERKKNPYDPIAHPSYFFREPGHAKDVTLDTMVSTMKGRKSSVDIGAKQGPIMRPLSATVKKTASLYSPEKKSQSTTIQEKKKESDDIEIPLFLGHTAEDYRAHKRRIIDLIIEHEIYKFQDLRDLCEKVCNKNQHLDRNKLIAIFDQINEELDK